MLKNSLESSKGTQIGEEPKTSKAANHDCLARLAALLFSTWQAPVSSEA